MRAGAFLATALLSAYPAHLAQASEGKPAPLVMGEIDAIRARVRPYFNVPEEARGQTLKVENLIELERDGAVTMVTIQQPPQPQGPLWTKVALAARRAVWQASPLPIPADKYDQFKKFFFVFNTDQNSGR